eukprot:9470278-Karenia_brevis.AAC.1
MNSTRNGWFHQPANPFPAALGKRSSNVQNDAAIANVICTITLEVATNVAKVNSGLSQGLQAFCIA